MTETCGPHTYDRMDVDLPERLRGSFGRGVPGVEHKVVDPATGAVLPPGEVGEICVRGYSLMLGLHKQEREDIFDRDGYYHTGDAGYFDADGVLFFHARLGEMIKTAGANVTPREVEVVLETFPEVVNAFVGRPARSRARPERRRGVVLKRGAELSADTARARLREQLSSYKVPPLVVVRGKRRSAVYR
jgi:acyl-CoA synthetase (AMP-forming)/AMP-acid ligase II